MTTEAETTTSEKKGIHPAVWVAIGCAGVLLVGTVVVGGLVGFGLFKARDFVGDLQDNPIRAVAELAIDRDPELEFIDSDDDAGTITFRNNRTGEVATMNFQDIAEGKFSVTTDEGEFTVDAQAADEGGAVTISGPEGEARFGASASLDNVPDWVPLYPNAGETQGTFQSETTDGLNGMVSQQTEDGATEVIEHFKAWLEENGYALQGETLTTTPQGTLGSITGERSENGRTVSVGVLEQGEETQVTINYTARPG